MSNELPDQLKQLQETLKTVNATTGEQEEALNDLRGHVDTIVDTIVEKMLYAPEPEEHHTLIERLEDVVVLFGSDYPDLAQAVNTTLTILANTGV